MNVTEYEFLALDDHRVLLSTGKFLALQSVYLAQSVHCQFLGTVTILHIFRIINKQKGTSIPVHLPCDKIKKLQFMCRKIKTTSLHGRNSLHPQSW